MDEVRAGRLTEDNLAVLAGRLSTTAFVAQWRGRTADLRAGGRRECDLVLSLGMVLSSAQRHLRAQGDMTPVAVLLPEAATVARRAAGPAEPPRDVLLPYLDGPDFLGVRAERRFKSNVILIGGLYRQAITVVEPLRQGGAWHRPEAVERLLHAADLLDTANQIHRRQARAPEEERNSFRDDVRGFFQTLVLNGRTWEGINAAHEPDVVIADPVFGIQWPGDAEYRNELARHMPSSEADRMHQNSRAPSLLEAFQQAAGLSLGLPSARDQLRNTGPALTAAGSAFAHLLSRHAAVSGAHVGVIHAVLRDTQEVPPTARVSSIAFGSGGRPVAAVERLAAERRKAARAVGDLATAAGAVAVRRRRSCGPQDPTEQREPSSEAQ